MNQIKRGKFIASCRKEQGMIYGLGYVIGKFAAYPAF